MSDIRSRRSKRAACPLPRRSTYKGGVPNRLKWQRSEWPPGCIYLLCRIT
ncbi:MAG: hypothetical protein M3174_03345 [Actinomycetota bacterium]|nr:hypothetical protein [Actinomycetota bacterium]